MSTREIPNNAECLKLILKAHMGPATQGDVDSAQICLKVMELQARMTGSL